VASRWPPYAMTSEWMPCIQKCFPLRLLRVLVLEQELISRFSAGADEST